MMIFKMAAVCHLEF